MTPPTLSFSSSNNKTNSKKKKKKNEKQPKYYHEMKTFLWIVFMSFSIIIISNRRTKEYLPTSKHIMSYGESSSSTMTATKTGSSTTTNTGIMTTTTTAIKNTLSSSSITSHITNKTIVPITPPSPLNVAAVVTVKTKTTMTSTASINDTSFFQKRSVPDEVLHDITRPWANVSTVAWFPRRFYSGFRNQIMAFTSMVLWCDTYNYSQILLPTIRHKDTYGTNGLIDFADLWDVPYWNSLYPALPRMVHCDPNIMTDYDCEKNAWRSGIEWENMTKPYPLSKQAVMFPQYKQYSRGEFNYHNPNVKRGQRHPMDLLMIQGGLRPHPNLQKLIDSMLRDIMNPKSRSQKNRARSVNDRTGQQQQQRQQQLPASDFMEEKAEPDIPYMTLHARVEPDMQAHMVCVEKKVLNLTHIFQFLEETFPDPPARHIFMPINRQYMEKEGTLPTRGKPAGNDTNWMAVHNLKTLNNAVQHGLWNGRSKVFEFGTNALRGTNTVYAEKWSISGAAVNFFIGLGGNVFVGSEVTSYALDLLAHRFYRNLTDNYYYLPDGLHRWTKKNPRSSTRPAGFSC